MAFSRVSLVSLVFLALTLHLVKSESQMSITSGSGRSLLQTTSIDCAAACRVRCGKSWKPNLCKRVCGTCCSRCNCVPPGTSVTTRAMCPCYATMTTRGGRLKCP